MNVSVKVRNSQAIMASISDSVARERTKGLLVGFVIVVFDAVLINSRSDCDKKLRELRGSRCFIYRLYQCMQLSTWSSERWGHSMIDNQFLPYTCKLGQTVSNKKELT
jgi:hypothetical protein